jgi:hypothetical protein
MLASLVMSATQAVELIERSVVNVDAPRPSSASQNDIVSNDASGGAC